MIKLKSLLEGLLVETPDSLKYNETYYKYNNGDSNVATFFSYHDQILDKVFYFGYSTLIKNFFSDNKDLLTILKLIESSNGNTRISGLLPEDVASVNRFIKYLHDQPHSGGHTELELLLGDLKRKDHNYDPVLNKSRSRLFRVVDDGGKKIFILTIWSPKDGDSFVEHKTFQEKCLRDIGVDPKSILYEVGEDNFETHNELFDNKGGDKSVDSEIDLEIKKLNNEYSELMGSLHTRGAVMSPAEEKKLQNQISAVLTKYNVLKKVKEQGGTTLADAEVQLSVLKVIQNAPESDPKSLGIAINAELEKKFKGMTLAQIKQIVKGVSLRDLVKEVYESFKSTRKNLFG